MVRTVTIVSLSSGILGETFIKHELDIGLERLHKLGLRVRFAPHALCGLEELKAHPEWRAQDLLDTFQDEETDLILCAIGGDDTYRLLPYLFEQDALKRAVSDKLFLGFSDTTMNHLMLHKVGIRSFYGQSFLADVCEPDAQMLPYTKHYFEELLQTGTIREIRPSEVWYQGRSDYSAAAVGTKMPQYKNQGFESLQGTRRFSGEILGGCIDTLYDIFNKERYADSVEVCRKYGIFPSLHEWEGKILLLESSEEKPEPERYRKMLEALKQTGIFSVLNGVLVGKPMDEAYFEDYKKLLVQVIDNPALPIVCNLNVGHATPRCIIPFGVPASMDVDRQLLSFSKP